MKKLCSKGVTVLTTIHQPSSDIFQLFDQLLLVQSGNLVYQGDASEAVNYFAKIGFKCPELSNPADYFFMHVLTELEGGPNFSQQERENVLSDAWKAHKNKHGTLEKKQPAENKYEVPPEAKTSTLLEQFQLLLKRSWREATRNPMRVR